jgi:hypothetical protein
VAGCLRDICLALAIAVVDEGLDLRGEDAADLPPVQVARPLAYAERDDNPSGAVSRNVAGCRIGEGKEVLVDISPATGREAGTHDHAIHG